MSLSRANEILLACDSYVNKNVKDVQLFWNRLWTVCGNGVIGIFAACQHPVESTELWGNEQEVETLAQDLLLCCENVHAILEEKQKCWPQDCGLARWVMGKVRGRQMENLLGGYLLGTAHIEATGLFGFGDFLGLKFWWQDRWVGWAPCLCSFVKSAGAGVIWPNWDLLA